MKTRNCLICKKAFLPRGRQKTCSPAHARAWNAEKARGYYAANPEKHIKASQRSYAIAYAANPEKFRERQRLLRLNDPEHYREQRRRSYHANKAKNLERSRALAAAWRDKNREKVRAKSRYYKSRDNEKIRERARQRYRLERRILAAVREMNLLEGSANHDAIGN